ncbi:MAG: MBL fold metallo-hydrolase [Azoarcus sp.]|jgi:glyoxylase-like metal-dependent hydrolase (beta-lactamase superfamily II)|nr:MBL fold metallo-hydrolase [Azoarcus sp.]
MFALGVPLLGLVLATAVHAAPPGPSESSETAVQSASPGYYRLTLGDFTVTALYDGHTRIPQKILHGLGAADIEASLARAFLPAAAPLNTSVNAYLVEMDKNLVLVDAGAANCFGPTLGKLRHNIRAAGHRPEAVTTILITHMHGDHVCGLADEQGKMAFPNATVWAAKDEAAHWLGQDNAGGGSGATEVARAALAPYISAKKFKTFVPPEPILPGLLTVATPGHTPGHTGYLFTSRAQRLYIWGDIVHSQAIQFARPEVSLDFDHDPRQAVATRKETLADTAGKRLLVAGAHLPFPGIGHIRAEADGKYQWVPLEFSQQLPPPGLPGRQGQAAPLKPGP